jgi:hypothetical protein
MIEKNHNNDDDGLNRLKRKEAAPLISAFVAHGARPRYLLLFHAFGWTCRFQKGQIAPRWRVDWSAQITLASPGTQKGKLCMPFFHQIFLPQAAIAPTRQYIRVAPPPGNFGRPSRVFGSKLHSRIITTAPPPPPPPHPHQLRQPFYLDSQRRFPVQAHSTDHSALSNTFIQFAKCAFPDRLEVVFVRLRQTNSPLSRPIRRAPLLRNSVSAFISSSSYSIHIYSIRFTAEQLL